MIGCDCVVCKSTDQRDNRLRSSILVQTEKTSLVVDTTPDFRYQMLRINNRRLDAVIYTHPHKDHLAGLDDIRAYNYFQKRPMDIYANTLTEEALRRDYYYAFSDTKYPGVPELNLITIDKSAFYIDDIAVQPIEVFHHKMPVFGFRFGDFTYITDANKIEEGEKEKIKGSKILVLNALRKAPHLSHFTLDEAVQLADELQVPEVYFTHISHQLGLHEQINRDIPPHMRLAFDGLQLHC